MTRPVSAQAARFERRLTRLYAAARQAYLRQQFGRANALSEEAEAARRQYVAAVGAPEIVRRQLVASLQQVPS